MLNFLIAFWRRHELPSADAVVTPLLISSDDPLLHEHDLARHAFPFPSSLPTLNEAVSHANHTTGIVKQYPNISTGKTAEC